MGAPWVLPLPELSMLVLALSIIVGFGVLCVLIGAGTALWWWYHPHDSEF